MLTEQEAERRPAPGNREPRPGEVAVVVLNWNNAPDTISCLESLARSGDPVVTYVVDNGSQDGSAEAIEGSGLADVFIQTGANLGYAGGNNVGVRRALDDGFEHVAVLNNDTVVMPGAFTTLLGHLRDRRATAVSPLITDLDRPDEAWFRGGVVDRGWPRHLQAQEGGPREVVSGSPFLTGCCLVAHRDTWSRVGLFDERLFLVFEDGDWSMRARRRGVDLVVAADAVVGHRVSASFRSPAQQRLSAFYFARNGLVWTARHQRSRLPHAVWRWGVRPALRDRERGGYSLAGLVAAASGQRGPAPRWVTRRLGRTAPPPPASAPSPHHEPETPTPGRNPVRRSPRTST